MPNKKIQNYRSQILQLLICGYQILALLDILLFWFFLSLIPVCINLERLVIIQMVCLARAKIEKNQMS